MGWTAAPLQLPGYSITHIELHFRFQVITRLAVSSEVVKCSSYAWYKTGRKIKIQINRTFLLNVILFGFADPGSASLNTTREELQITASQSVNPATSSSFAECLPSTSSAAGDVTITSSTSAKPSSSEHSIETPVTGKRMWRKRTCSQVVLTAVSSSPVIKEKQVELSYWGQISSQI